MHDAYCTNPQCPALLITGRPAWLGQVDGTAVLRCSRCKRRYRVTASEWGVTVQEISGSHDEP